VLAVILGSLLGFSLWAALDLSLMRQIRQGPLAVSLLASAALAVAYILSVPLGTPLGLPAWMTYLGWGLAVLGLLLIIFSIFIEIPWRARSGPILERVGSSPTEGVLVTSGTYALCRHPGALWMILFLIGAVLAVGRSGMLFTAFLWIGLDVLLVAVQDRFIFPVHFPAYRQYQQTTPFLIPTPSAVRCALHHTSESHVAAPAENQ
jgi:protein-S-isoprenylcysteine O-methyltransferase Ste14